MHGLRWLWFIALISDSRMFQLASAVEFQWRQSSPADVGMSVEGLERFQHLQTERRVRTCVIVRRDAIVWKWPGDAVTTSSANRTDNLVASLLSLIKSKRTPNQPLDDLLKSAILLPIGIDTAEISLTAEKSTALPEGDRSQKISATCSAEAVMRLGRLLLHKGYWDAESVLSTEAVRAMVHTHGQQRDESAMWRNNMDGRFPELPFDTFWIAESSGAVLLVVPSLELIVFCQGMEQSSVSEAEKQTHEELPSQVFGPLVLAVQDRQQLLQAPYPKSPKIVGIDIDWTTHVRRAMGSDNWQMTWADDGHQYAAWGDGGGFGGSNSRGRVSLGVARIEGSLDELEGYNVWGGADGENPATFPGKSWGMICLDGVLYMWVGKGSGLHEMQAEARLHRSTDHGATWQAANWAFTAEQDLTIPTICQFGKDGQGASDDFAYHYFLPASEPAAALSTQLRNGGDIFLARVPRTQIMDSTAYEFFGGLGPDLQPWWNADPQAKRPIFHDANGTGWCLSVSYNFGLQRYVLVTNHGISSRGNLGFFDAPQPWGPWTTVAYCNQAEGTHFGRGHVSDNVFFANFPTKWQSPGGLKTVIVFTGGGRGQNNDSFNAVRAKFQVRAGRR